MGKAYNVKHGRAIKGFRLNPSAFWEKIMAAASKTSYTVEQSAELVAAYNAAADADARSDVVQAFATKFGKTVKSVVAKLSREGVYKKVERTRKDGSAIQKKDQTADAIGVILKLSEADTDSLTKANRTALQAIFNALAISKPID